jgi:hypothetical protein
MNKEQEAKIEEHYKELLDNKTINTLNDGYIYKLAIDKAFSLQGVGCSNKSKYKKAFKIAMEYINTTIVSMEQSKENDSLSSELKNFINKHKLL